MQNYTSKNTSVNTKNLPAVYNKVCWDKLPEDAKVLDWGCGKDRRLIIEMMDRYDLAYIGFDPYWLSDKHNKLAESLLGKAEVFICSNVLNVIDDDNVIKDICNKATQHKYFFITVYEGNKSGVGKRSKEDCYQRNDKLKYYLKYFPQEDNICIKKGVITNAPDLIK